jgi:hypothetical protein
VVALICLTMRPAGQEGHVRASLHTRQDAWSSKSPGSTIACFLDSG